MISLICEKYNITNYTINDDGTIDVNGNVFLSSHGLTELPIRFNRVDGNFYCGNNNLTSLKGCPRWISGDFGCQYNRLSNLEFSPEYVGGWFSCIFNKNFIDNYCDTEIGSYFYTSLKQDGLIFSGDITAINYNEWRKLYKRKKILDKLFI